MKSRFLAWLLFLPLLSHGGGAAAANSSVPTPGLTLEKRIKAQTAIERIFFEKRIWPKENKTPKPPFEQMVPKELIEKKVNESLLKSAALEKYWGRSVTPQMLQAELERMSKGTQDAQTLHDLFEALGNDPQLIAETLARETLSDRLVRSWYAWDTRFHADARARAEALASDLSSFRGRGRAGGAGEGAGLPPGFESHRHTYIFDEHADQTPPMPDTNPDESRVKADEFAVLKRKYSGTDPARSPLSPVGAELSSALFSGMNRNETPRGRAELSSTPTSDHTRPGVDEISPHPQETAEGFTLTRPLSITETRIEIETILIRKTTFDDWWEKASADLAPSTEITAVTGGAFPYKLPAIASATDCDQWQSAPGLNNVPPNARDSHTAIWTGAEMIVWGGYNGWYFNTGARYNPSTDSWSPTSGGANVPSARYAHTAVWTGTEMIVWGGIDNSSSLLASGGRYNPNSDLWSATSTGANAPSARIGHSAVWTGGQMIIWGGPDNSGTRYDPVLDSWLPTSMGANVPSSRASHRAVWTGNEMIVWGGNNGTSPLNSGGRYSPASDTWQPTSTGANVPVGRVAHAAVWTGSEMIVWGGRLCGSSCANTYYNDGGRYNPSTDSWAATSIGTNVPAPRTVQGAVWTGTEMIVWGGQTTGGAKLNSGGRYNPVTNSWAATSTAANVPSARFAHSEVWTGSELIIWGGYGSGELLTGGRYNPASDNWVPTSTGGNAPSARAYHTATWTGSEMIVWGGSDGVSFFNTGGRYNLATDTWGTTSVGMNVPSARYVPTAVWTGNEMIIWGGDGSSGTLNTGSRYSPSSDSWVPMAIDANTPTGRSLHTAVWTGSVMIVWGGTINASTFVNSGGRYNPILDSWTQTFSTNAPAGRRLHSAVWSGNEMIIWGGDKVSQYFNDGGKYSPLTDSWISTSMENPPDVRSSHIAVWNGSQMIIWGGIKYAAQYIIEDSGGQYDPIVNRWTATSINSNLPSARYDFIGTWTGAEMIIWGGRALANTPMSTGGRYYDSPDLWKSMSTGAYTPGERYRHTAIWNGNKMVIWGGSGVGNTFYYNTGGIYSSGSIASPGNSLHGRKTSSIYLNWPSVYGAGSYNLKRCNPSASGCIPGTIISTPTINQYSEPDDGLSHFYVVEAVNQCGATP